MPFAKFAIALACLMPLVAMAAQTDDERRVRDADAQFWRAYKACDMQTMAALLTTDVEFYHDRTGLTTSREGVIDSLRKGPCADPRMHLRREAVDDSLRFHPLAGGYAVLSGRHRFYVHEAGQPERLDGQAEFTTLWQSEQGQWRMHRVLSYDHGPVPYAPPATRLTLPPATLAAYAGRYRSGRIGDIDVTVDGDHLRLTAGQFVATLQAESATRFFAMERDLRFDFETDANGRTRALAVYENGTLSERAERVR